MDAQLVAVQVKSTPCAVVHKYRWFCDSATDLAVLQVFQEEDLGAFKQSHLGILTVDDPERTAIRTLLSRYCYFLTAFAVNAGYLGWLGLDCFEFLQLFHFLHSKVLIPSRKFKLLLWLQLLLKLQQSSVDLLEELFVVLTVVSGKYVVDLYIVFLHLVVMSKQLR